MKTISKHISDYIHKHIEHPDKIEELSELIENFFCNIDDELVDVKNEFVSELEDFTEEIDMEMMSAIVEHLKQKDGTVSGQKWSVEETTSVAKQYDVENKVTQHEKKFDQVKFWLAMNYVYAVHYSVNRTINGYVDLAIDEYCNKNICFDHLIKKVFEKI